MKRQLEFIHHIQLISCLLLIGVIFIKCTEQRTNVSVDVTPYEVTKQGAWCWFADPRAIHHQNESGTINNAYIGYIDTQGNIKASQYDFIKKEKKEVLIRSYFQPDDHNNPTFLILPDDRVMILYSRHTDEACFYYRISTKPGDITALGEEFKIPTKNNTTYPSPFILSDDPDHFYLCWRGISWHPTIAKLTIPDAKDHTQIVWGPYQMVQSTASRPYAKYATNGKDRIMMAYTTGHPDPTMPNWLYYNYIDINTLQLKDVRGKVLSDIGKEVYQVSATPAYKEANPDAVVHQSNLRDWLWQTTEDEKGNPVIAMVEINEDKSSHDYFYTRWNGKAWQRTFLSNGGGHFHQSKDIEHCYSGGMAIDDQNPNEVYCSVPVEGKHGKVYELIKYVMDQYGKVSVTDTITHDSQLNNVRPYIIPDRGASPLTLAWMHGNYYDWIVSEYQPKGYSTAIYADFGFENKVETRNEITVYKDGKSVNVTDVIYGDQNKDVDFALLVNLELDTANYAGTIFSTGDVSYGVDIGSTKPYVQVAGQEKVLSTNVFGNSNIWQVKPRGTGGAWYKPTPFTKVELEIIYDKDQLTTKINGAIDQVIEYKGLTFEQLEFGEIVKSKGYSVMVLK